MRMRTRGRRSRTSPWRGSNPAAGPARTGGGRMADHHATAALLTSAVVAADVFDLRPDYRALLLVAEGIMPAPSDERSDALLRRAEEAATAQLAAGTVEDLPHIAAWRDAYRAF